MMLSNEKLKCRKVLYVLKYYVPNKHTKREECAHHILFIYYSFRDENDLKSNNSYVEKLNQPNVLEVINLNRIKVESYATLVEDALKDWQQITRPTLIHLVSVKIMKFMID